MTRRDLFKFVGALGLGRLLPAAPAAAPGPVSFEALVTYSPSQAALAMGEMINIGIQDGIAGHVGIGSPVGSLLHVGQTFGLRPDEWLDLPADEINGMIQAAQQLPPPTNAQLNARLLTAEGQISGLVTSAEGLADRLERLEALAGSPGPHPDRIEQA